MAKILGQDTNKKIIRHAISANMPVLLIGDTGTGKTTVVRELAEEASKSFTRINLTGQTSTDEFVGKWLVKDGSTYWIDGVLTKAMREGSWLLVDEINAALPEILFRLHSLLDDDRFILLDEKDNEVVKPHDSFRLFATMNESAEYAGTKELNKAFLSRFGVVLKFEYPSPSIEEQAVMEQAKVIKEEAKIMVGMAGKLRKLKQEEKIYYTCSTRDVINWARLSKEIGLADAFACTILTKAIGDYELVADTFVKAVAPLNQAVLESGVLNPRGIEDVLSHLNTQINTIRTEKAELDAEIKAFNERKDEVVKEIIADTFVKKVASRKKQVVVGGAKC